MPEQVIYDQDGEALGIVVNPERREWAIEKIADLLGLENRLAEIEEGAAATAPSVGQSAREA